MQSERFTEFLIYLRCKAVADGDGCIMCSDDPGVGCVALIAGTTGTVMTTYRMTKADWTAITFSVNQGSYATAMGSWTAVNKIDITASSTEPVGQYIDYLDAFNCAYTTTNVPFRFTCVAYQPGWEDY